MKIKRLRITSCGADDYYSLYRAGYYVNTDRKTRRFYWDHESDRHIIWLDDATIAQAKRISEGEDTFQFAFCRNSTLVLDRLQNPEIKPRSWLTGEVREIYEALLTHEFAFTIEAYKDNSLVGGLFGIALGRLVTLDTMYGLSEPAELRSASKIALCETFVQMHAAGIKVVDVEVEHKRDHPARRLGEQKLSMQEFRRLLLEHGGDGPQLLRRHFSCCWSSQWAASKFDLRDE
jgi:leucyl/phenylalanyl-tRNA---protein transferase